MYQLQFYSTFFSLLLLSTVFASPTSGTSNGDIQAYLNAHNTVRAQHGAVALTWSDNLASKAQQWANGCVFKHSGGKLGPYGGLSWTGAGSRLDI